ncbi:MAG: leucine-rich repeat protein [Prevotella sp.]|nr:leucine-rich repeat protein [Prevotella sp.]
MNNIRHIVLILSCLAFCCTMTARTKVVNVSVPGTLQQKISKRQQMRIADLVVSGPLNGADLRLLRAMAGVGVDGKPTGGRLRRLDMSDATLVPGGEPYAEVRGRKLTVLGGNVFPARLFAGSKLDDFTFPQSTDTIDSKALYASDVRRVLLPDNLVTGDSVMADCRRLTEVGFPADVVSFDFTSLHGCDSLRVLMFNNIGYIGYHRISNMKSLETVEVRGVVAHIDGWFCYRLPSLRRVLFRGDVLTTGGPGVAQDCPLLEKVEFGGMVLLSGLSDAPGCPLLKKCDTKGSVVYSNNRDFLPSMSLRGDGDGEALNRKIVERVEQANKGPFGKFVGTLDDLAYDLACGFSMAGDTAIALRYLSMAVDKEKCRYGHVISDHDLDNIRNTVGYRALLPKLREQSDYLYILRNCNPYRPGSYTDGKTFTYAKASDERMKRIRQYFRLDSIAGGGSDVDKMKRVMHWLHNTISHDGSGGYPDGAAHNAIDLYAACMKQQRGLNCRGLADVLSELYMAMGWPSRFVTCQPRAYDTDGDCHVITMVWSRSMGKWLWMDPTFDTWVTDEHGVLLSIREVRERLREGKPLAINPDANWNNRNKQTKEDYLDNYMAKNLYYLSTHLHSDADIEGGPLKDGDEYISLMPVGMDGAHPGGKDTNDDDWFWQAAEKTLHGKK